MNRADARIDPLLGLEPWSARVRVGSVTLGGGAPLVLVAGPCVIEGESVVLRIADKLSALTSRLKIPLIFKASFDKANRTSASSFRGLGQEEGLRILERVGRDFGLPLTTDVHEVGQVAAVAEVVDLMQIPALLCRQLDLLRACSRSGRPVNIKKGPFMAPAQMKEVRTNAIAFGCEALVLTERGTCFGYHDLIVDFRAMADLGRLGSPLLFDVTHALQRPGALGSSSAGEPRWIPPLLRAAVALGVDGLFMEVHDRPDKALSDAAIMPALDDLEPLLEQALALDETRRLLGERLSGRITA